MQRLMVASVAFLSACGPAIDDDAASEGCDPWRQTCVVTLSASSTESERLELAAVEVATVDVEDAEVDDGFVVVDLSMEQLTLRAPDEGGVCLFQDTFSSLTDVPPLPCDGACRGLYHPCLQTGFSQTDRDGSGFVVADGEGDHYRVRLRSHAENEDGSRTMTVEYTGIR